MEKSFEIIKGARSFVTNLLKEFSIEQLNIIPEGFNNNLIWNFGHVISVQQGLCYLSSGEKPVVDLKLIQKYKSGSKPEGIIDSAEYDQLENEFFSTIDRLEEDLKNGLFKNYKAFELSSYADLRIENIEDAIKFVAFHDGLHVGYMMALKRVLKHTNLYNS
ncbi:MAG: DinB family protein [Ginsengibacter sp.]